MTSCLKSDIPPKSFKVLTQKDLFAQTHARTVSNPVLSEALEATHLNVEVEDPKLYHGNCVDVIANGSVDLVLNERSAVRVGL